MTTYTGLGLTSGTSLDGLDVCLAEFVGDLDTDIWSFRILEGCTYPYDEQWRQNLASAHVLSGLELIQLHHEYSHFMGRAIQKFMQRLSDLEKSERPGGNPDPRIDFVAADGHTVFHQPDNRLTFQLGEGQVLSTYLKCPLITNFRVKDVSLGGQGAPLTGCVDRFLFLGVGLCLNLGGIASLRVREDCSAWDVCACNNVFNRLAKMHDLTLSFDKDGELASQGRVVVEVLRALESLQYYRQPGPKSISLEWINDHVWPILDSRRYSLADLARTYVEHVALRVRDACLMGNRGTGGAPSSPLSASSPPSFSSSSPFSSPSSSTPFSSSAPLSSSPSPSGAAARPKKYGDGVVLITGGGVHNGFLLTNIREKLRAAGIEEDEDTEPETVDFKEAASVAFLGMRCMLGKPNVFAQSTGASTNSISGSVHHPLNKNFRGSYPSTYRFMFRKASQS